MTQTLLHGVFKLAHEKIRREYMNVPPHHLRQIGEIVAITSVAHHDLKDASLSPDILSDYALRHHQVLTAYAASTSVVPIKFGAVFSSMSALEEYLAKPKFAGALENQLAQFSELQEYGIRLTQQSQRPTNVLQMPAESGRSYLRGRAKQKAGRHELSVFRKNFVTDLVSKLEQVAAKISPDRTHSDRLLDSALLIHKSKRSELEQFVSAFSMPAMEVGLELKLTGPWPVYSFIEPTVDGDAHAA